ncbi:hypothetical protein EJ08DRAFT_595743 [Tothia fuscella]|uniref:Uncharacterized protein n=1 Tax=Tothia fuscella TaxID=1048955 RepID=A0A9P4NJC9_9PEZI|nr:hypothetical protein EJ08DRAFT_595743 [Tothia fuscella]
MKRNITKPTIIDIRCETNEHSILDDIKKGLRPEDGKEKSLPTLLLYDEAGLKLFEDITYLDEYYLTGAEIEVLGKYANSIAERIQPDSIVVELGSGNLRKIQVLLNALEAVQKKVEYFALDLSMDELERTLSQVPSDTFEYVQCYGLHGTYDDGLEWLKSSQYSHKAKTILTMGSSVGNFKRHEAPGFLGSFAAVLNETDTILVGIDGCQDGDKIYHAYNDTHGVTHSFILNGLYHANRLLGYEAFVAKEWKVIGEYDRSAGRHHAFVSPIKDVTIDGVMIPAGERIRIEESYKYSERDVARLWGTAGLVEGAKWSNRTGDYALHMAYKPKFQFAARPDKYAASPVPSATEWASLWVAWDTVTREMIPEDDLLTKPIKLRNACIFYLGHIPTFLAIHLHRATEQGVEGIVEYRKIFERGVDPDVDNPELCHDHSEIPDEWPAVHDVLAFQDRVRAQLLGLYKSQMVESNAALRRAVWLAFEHEAMHLETLLYMLVQSERTQPPKGTIRPDFEAMAAEARAKSIPNEWFNVPTTTLTLGLHDDEKSTETRNYFGWDNEKPARKVSIPAFTAKARPITNREYAKYLDDTGAQTIPASWTQTQDPIHYNGSYGATAIGTDGLTNGHGNGHSSFLQGKSVRTVFGPIPLSIAADWPVMASYDELLGCANWMGGRIPTLEEVRSIYEYADQVKSKELENESGRRIPAVNSHLINDGVEETPPPSGSVNGFSSSAAGPSPNELFANLEDANVGFKHWHPTPVVQNGSKLSGQGEFGGVWEWTSSVLQKHEGFEPMTLYPQYTADFLDGKHNVTLGGSWATHPRIAGRKTFVNWYQRNYPYVWAGARLVRDN